MERMELAFKDVNTGKEVFYHRDLFGRLWIARGPCVAQPSRPEQSVRPDCRDALVVAMGGFLPFVSIIGRSNERHLQTFLHPPARSAHDPFCDIRLSENSEQEASGKYQKHQSGADRTSSRRAGPSLGALSSCNVRQRQ
jgi:hypothetical protein